MSQLRGYLEGVKALCEKHDALFLLDEVQTGVCRTGKWFCLYAQHRQA